MRMERANRTKREDKRISNSLNVRHPQVIIPEVS